jgi:hypothetical protein
MAPPYAVSFCGCVLYGGHAWGSFMSAGFPYRPVYQPAHGRHLRLVAKVMAPVNFDTRLYLCSKPHPTHQIPIQSPTMLILQQVIMLSELVVSRVLDNQRLPN